MSSARMAEHCPACSSCPVAGLQISLLCRVTKLSSASGVCPMSAWQSSFLRQVDVQFPGNRTLSWIRGMSIVFKADIRRASNFSSWEAELCLMLVACTVVGWQKSVLRQKYVKWPGYRTLSYARGMSSGLFSELYSASGACPVALW
ncbi:hypothetical protein TNIN_175991 [Trichonephila inaurata madagascariensis]|uniref:Uncharacterized protein n=1 Tax=Trichonephila inaurata madagascariensis TaxID=2747483 RepID=A0A8X6XGW6_9ARAC|nr:hypothetical protein TNIN_175991 [Trichonephila inaurata madagascariensis]